MSISAPTGERRPGGQRRRETGRQREREKERRDREGDTKTKKEEKTKSEKEALMYKRVIPWVRREGSGGKRERGQDTKRSNGDVHNARGRAGACALARNGATLSAPLGGINRSRALASTRTYDPKNSQLARSFTLPGHRYA